MSDGEGEELKKAFGELPIGRFKGLVPISPGSIDRREEFCPHARTYKYCREELGLRTAVILWGGCSSLWENFCFS